MDPSILSVPLNNKNILQCELESFNYLCLAEIVRHNVVLCLENFSWQPCHLWCTQSGALDIDVFDLLICVHVIWKKFCSYLVYHKSSAATNHSELTSSRQAVDWAVPQTEPEQEWGNHCRVEHLKRFAVPAEYYAHRSPVRQEKEGAEEPWEERREGKRQWKWMCHWWILLQCLI